MMTKVFDCVEMKRQGALRVHEKMQGMSIEEQVAYWQERNREFLREKHASTVTPSSDRHPPSEEASPPD